MPERSPTSHRVANSTAALFALLGLILAILVVSSTAEARSARRSSEVRVAGTCGNGATSALRLEAEDGEIRIRFSVDSNRGHTRWRVVLVREGRVVWTGRARTDGGGSLKVRRRISNLSGADQVIARALGPGGITCIAVANLQS